jgi:hypothetical protein
MVCDLCILTLEMCVCERESVVCVCVCVCVCVFMCVYVCTERESLLARSLLHIRSLLRWVQVSLHQQVNQVSFDKDLGLF